MMNGVCTCTHFVSQNSGAQCVYLTLNMHGLSSPTRWLQVHFSQCVSFVSSPTHIAPKTLKFCFASAPKCTTTGAANAHTVQVIIKLFLLLNKRFSRISCALKAGKQKKRDVDNDDDDDKKENYGKKWAINMRETSDEHMNYNCIVSSVSAYVCVCVMCVCCCYSSHHIKWVHLHHTPLHTITCGDHNANDDHINFSINIHIYYTNVL